MAAVNQYQNVGWVKMVAGVRIAVLLIGLVMAGCTALPEAALSAATGSTSPSTALPSPTSSPGVTPAASDPAGIPSAQPWNSALPLIVNQPDGVWLRSEPSHLSLDENLVILADQSAVRVIGQPVYEADPGQWWWLVSAESGGIGWVEEISLSLVSNGR